MSNEQEIATKKSPLFGTARSWLRTKDKAIGKLIENGIERWLKARKEYVDSLPEVTRDELAEEGMLDPPTVTLPPSAMNGVSRKR